MRFTGTVKHCMTISPLRVTHHTHALFLNLDSLLHHRQDHVYRPLRQLITSCYLSVICRKTGARRRCSGGQDSVLSTFASFRDDFEHRPAHF